MPTVPRILYLPNNFQQIAIAVHAQTAPLRLSEKVKKEVVNKVAEMIGAKKLFVPPLEELLKIMPKGISYCTYCLGGPHPITKKN